MHGIILAELKKFVDMTWDSSVWPELLRRCQLDSKIHMPVAVYPDDDFENLIKVLSGHTNIDQRDLLERFGEKLASGLMSTYGSMIDPQWRTLDVVEHAGGMMHSVTKRAGSPATAPLLTCSRVTRTTLNMTYMSSRQLCRLARGIMKGLASRYNEAIEINEITCMLVGATHCTFEINCDRKMRQSTGIRLVKP